MKRCYCDVCSKEITRNVITNRVKGTVIRPSICIGVKSEKSVMVEIMCGVSDIMNGGELCLECLRGIIMEIIDKEIATAKEMTNEMTKEPLEQNIVIRNSYFTT